MESTEVTDPKDLSPEDKLRAIEQVIPVICKNPNLVISGSVARELSLIAHQNRNVLLASDVARVGDLDIGSITFSEEDMQLKQLTAIAKNTGFHIDVGTFFQNCVYPSSGKQHLALNKITILVTGVPYEVKYTTPEFLLLSLAGESVSEKTPSAKYQRKVRELQSLPTFSPQNFIELARSEVNARYNLNQDTFSLWREHVLKMWRLGGKKDFGEVLDKEYEVVSSLIDDFKLFNKVKTPKDLETLDFADVRHVPNIEALLAEFQQNLGS